MGLGICLNLWIAKLVSTKAGVSHLVLWLAMGAVDEGGKWKHIF